MTDLAAVPERAAPIGAWINLRRKLQTFLLPRSRWLLRSGGSMDSHADNSFFGSGYARLGLRLRLRATRDDLLGWQDYR